MLYYHYIAIPWAWPIAMTDRMKMDRRFLKILLALSILFVATGAATMLHCHEEGHELGAEGCQVCHWLTVAISALIVALVGLWLHIREVRPALPAVVLLPRVSGRPRSASSRAPPR